MADVSWFEDVWPLLVLVACILLFFWGRAKGRQNLANMLSSARAEGHAEATAELRAMQTVNVVAGNSGLSSPDGISIHDAALSEVHRLLAIHGNSSPPQLGVDPVGLERILSAYRRSDSVISGGRTDDHYDDHDDDIDVASAHRGRVADGIGSAAVRASGWDAVDRADNRRGVHGGPAAGVNNGRGPGR